MFKYIVLFILVCCFGCSTSNSEPISICFSADSNKILISNIDPAGLYQIKNNIKTDTMYQKLVSVLQTPAEDDSVSMEMDWPGTLSVAGDSLVFIPNKPFVKGKNYLVETMINSKFASGADILKSDVGHSLKPQQKTLIR